MESCVFSALLGLVWWVHAWKCHSPRRKFLELGKYVGNFNHADLLDWCSSLLRFRDIHKVHVEINGFMVHRPSNHSIGFDSIWFIELIASLFQTGWLSKMLCEFFDPETMMHLFFGNVGVGQLDIPNHPQVDVPEVLPIGDEASGEWKIYLKNSKAT